MKYFLIIIFLFSLSLTGCGDTSSTDNQNNAYTASRTTTINNMPDTNVSNADSNNEAVNTVVNDIASTNNTETELSSFSTKIYTPNDKARQNNIKITCSKLNETIVKSGETFSFCNTVGKASPEEGYQKADIFDKDGNVIKGYGGGNCQISSTLYNALLELPNIEIVERHNHSKKVYYVPERKRCCSCLW